MSETLVEANPIDPGSVDLGEDQTRYLRVLTILLTSGLWGSQLFRSLWLDELGSYWIVKGGIIHATQRALQYQGESPFYYWLLWISRNLFGRSEISLRVPSVIAGAIGTYLIYRLGRRLIDKEMGLLAAAVFASFSSVAFAAVDARPYSLALALSIGATTALLQWLESSKRSWAVLYVILAALTVYAHFIFALALLPHLVFSLARKGKRPPLRNILGAWIAIVILTIPVMPQFISLLSRRSALTIPTQLTADKFWTTLAPPILIVGIVAGFLISRLFDATRLAATRPQSPSAGRLVFGFALPSTVLFALSIATPTTLFQPRYYLMQVPYLALLAGWGLRSFEPERARRVALLSLAVVSVLSYQSINADMAQNWRGAAKTVNAFVHDATTPVLVRTALIESRDVSWLRDPKRQGYLLSPLSLYPMEGKVIALPFDLTHGGSAYLEALVSGPLMHAKRFVLVSNYATPIEDWLEGRLQDTFAARIVWSSGSTHVTEFMRPIQQ